MKNALILYRKQLPVADKLTELLALSHDTPTHSFDLERWLRYANLNPLSYDWEQHVQEVREFSRIDFNKNVQLYDLNGGLLDMTQLTNFSPKGAQLNCERSLHRRDIVLLATDAFRAAGEVKYHRGEVCGCEFIAVRFFRRHLLIDTRV